MNIAKIVFFILIAFISVKGQSFFKGSAVIGMNASQIDGDDLAGYHKYGLTGGLKIEFPLNPVLDMGIEFLYSQRGSRTAIYNNIFQETYRINLDYISLPIVIKWNDWWIEDKAYYKVNLHGGFSNGYLINAKIDDSPVLLGEPLRNYDLSWLLGGGFSFTKNWVLTIRYNRSINAVYTGEPIPGRETRRLLGYFLTLRSEYNF